MHPTRAGLTTIELLIVVTVFAIMLPGILMVGRTSEHAYRTGVVSAQLESQCEVALTRVTNELRLAILASFPDEPVPGAGLDEVQYSIATGFVNDSVTWSPPRSIELRLEPGELDDGLDNNGNDLVDERQVVLTRNVGAANEREMVLTRWVAELVAGELANGVDDNGNGLIDEPGFGFQWLDEEDCRTLVVWCTLERRDDEGHIVTRTAWTSTRIRN